MNIGRYQLLFVPGHRRLFALEPSSDATKRLGLFRHIYDWIAFFWPFELRRFKAKP